MAMKTLAQLAAAGRAHGAAGTFVVRQAVFGSRNRRAPGADVRNAVAAAAGVVKPSVFKGPARAAVPGAPVLRRW